MADPIPTTPPDESLDPSLAFTEDAITAEEAAASIIDLKDAVDG